MKRKHRPGLSGDIIHGRVEIDGFGHCGLVVPADQAAHVVRRESVSTPRSIVEMMTLTIVGDDLPGDRLSLDPALLVQPRADRPAAREEQSLLALQRLDLGLSREAVEVEDIVPEVGYRRLSRWCCRSGHVAEGSAQAGSR